jgi:hypothetical protein
MLKRTTLFVSSALLLMSNVSFADSTIHVHELRRELSFSEVSPSSEESPDLRPMPCSIFDKGPARMVAMSSDGKFQHLVRFTVTKYTYIKSQNRWFLTTRTKFEQDKGNGSYDVFYRNEGYFVNDGATQIRFPIQLKNDTVFSFQVSCPDQKRLVNGTFEVTNTNGTKLQTGSLRFFAANKVKPATCTTPVSNEVMTFQEGLEAE